MGARGEVRGYGPRTLSFALFVSMIGLACAPLAAGSEEENICSPDSDWDPANASNFTPADRENDYDIRWVVIHDIEGTAAGAISWFKNPSAQASAHYIVDFDASKYPRPVCMVDDTDIGWQAGNWGYNQRSIGIEHAGWAAQDKYTDWEYDTSAKLTAWLLKTYNIPLQLQQGIGPCDPSAGSGILAHSQIPNPNDCSKGGGSGGHTDPGPFWDWTKYMGYVSKYYNGAPQHGAQHSGDSYPATMEAGKQHIVWSEFVNNGTATWTPGGTNPFRLGTAAPQDRPSDFETPGNWMTSTRPTDVDSTTAPGATGRFTFIMTAPRVHNRTYTETWRLVQEGITWFGPEIAYTVNVVDTLPPFQAPGLVAPPDGALVGKADVGFTWTAADDNGSGISEYDLVVSRSSDPGDQGSFVKLETVNESTLAWTLNGLPDGKLYWWVGARDHAASWVLSPVWTLTVDAQGPTAALPRSPTDGAFVKTTAVELKWDAASDAGGIKEYVIAVSQSADISDKSKMVREEKADGATSSLSVAGLPEGRLYWWVSASDNSNHSSTSLVFSFTKDTLPPKVAESTPAAGAKLKEVTKVSVRMDEDLDPAQPLAGLLKLYGPDQKEVPCTVVLSASVVSATPAAALGPGEYRAVLSKDARDRAGNALDAPHEWTFSVEENKTGGGTQPGSAAQTLMQSAGPLLVWQWVVLAAVLAVSCMLLFMRRRRRVSTLRPTAPPGDDSSNSVPAPPDEQPKIPFRE